MGLVIHRKGDPSLEGLPAPKVAVIGYGNQGAAHALNLRGSGFEVFVGQRPGGSADRARDDGFEPLSVSDAVARADLLILGLPDEVAALVYSTEIAPVMRKGQALGFIHGFNIRYGFIEPPGDVDVVMVAPKGPGSLLRSIFLEGKGLPSLLAVHQDATGVAQKIALGWAVGIGSDRAGIVETTFADETETDLFGEQVVLCGGVSALTKAAFETLVDAGYEPEFAYLECVHELKQVADLLYERGLSAMRDKISNTAEYGDLTRGPRIIGDPAREEMKKILGEIRSGEFAKEWIGEFRSGAHKFRSLYNADADSLYERTGKNVRALMPWL